MRSEYIYVTNNEEKTSNDLSKLVWLAEREMLRSPSRQIRIYRVWPGKQTTGFEHYITINNTRSRYPTTIFRDLEVYNAWKIQEEVRKTRSYKGPRDRSRGFTRSKRSQQNG